jgi:Ser/Thr protein kinase RdoA (MazF antagonist)
VNWQATLISLPDDVVMRAAQAWGVEASERVSQSANTVFKLRNGDYLRLVHSGLRDAQFVAAGVDWARHLRDNGARVSTARESRAGNSIERVDDWIATVWTGAPGMPLGSDLGTQQLEMWGESAELMHRASASYAPTPVRASSGNVEPERFFLRQFWQNIVSTVSKDPQLLEAHGRLTPFLEALPETDWVVCHGDFRPANAIWDGANVTVIDFDEPVLAPSEYDIARAMSTDNDGLFPNLSAHLETFARGYERASGAPIHLERLQTLIQLHALLSLSWSLEDTSWGWTHDLRTLALEGVRL